METADDRILGGGDEGLPKLPSKVFGAFAIFLTVGFGVALGGFVSYDRMVEKKAQGLVFGEYEEFVSPNIQQAFLGAGNPENSSESEPLTPDGFNQPQLLYPTPAEPVSAPSALNPCKDPFDELSRDKTAAEAEFAANSAAAKSVFDQEQKNYNAQLIDYSRQRAAAINNYLGQIAIATSKYNQSSDSDARDDIYKQEQSQAFEVYSQAVNKIGSDSKIVELKKQSETKYNVALTSLQNQLNQDLARIQADYQAKTAGKNCSG